MADHCILKRNGGSFLLNVVPSKCMQTVHNVVTFMMKIKAGMKRLINEIMQVRETVSNFRWLHKRTSFVILITKIKRKGGKMCLCVIFKCTYTNHEI